MFDALEKRFQKDKHEQPDLINDLYQGSMKDYVKCLAVSGGKREEEGWRGSGRGRRRRDGGEQKRERRGGEMERRREEGEEDGEEREKRKRWKGEWEKMERREKGSDRRNPETLVHVNCSGWVHWFCSKLMMSLFSVRIRECSRGPLPGHPSGHQTLWIYYHSW